MGKCEDESGQPSVGDPASPKPEPGTFNAPPEAPVFEPTPEEFADPLAYISKIRPVAEKCGICKIRPPESWQPPFAVDVDNLRFTPRIQRLNELEAITRVKLNFLDQIIKFWELQGSMLKIPTVERKPLDLYTLHKMVKEAGGFEACTSERKWSAIARRMGHPRGKGAGSILKGHYERILYPHDVFTGEEPRTAVQRDRDHSPARRTDLPETAETRRSPRENKWAGDQRAGLRSRRLREHRVSNMTVCVTPAPAPEPDGTGADPLARYVCRVCSRGDAESAMLLCDGCDDSYHTFCLLPPLPEVPPGDWRCPVCLAAAVSRPQEAFGFEQASREYTLQQFGEMADRFKSAHFNLPVHLVPPEAVEREFWRLVSSLGEDVTVHYGADLHSMDHGSGFPPRGDLDYGASPWNLNNLPVLPGSVLRHIHADISGMKVPWLYVGMCFATFCWHNEDHWSYSINYLHWGEPKTWYGVPGSDAERFETAMKAAAPELFDSQPDLLHQLVTIMHPDVLRGAGVPVYRTDQRAGEFVITFPRAYHAGFNQGYNFAEAVNFAPADWLAAGRECVAHYSQLRRHCVFAHDELVCNMAERASDLEPPEALAALRELRALAAEERRRRRALQEWGVRDAERELPESLPDDERQCAVCRTTCFLSSVRCECGVRACLPHAKDACACPARARQLRYRYTLDELPELLGRLQRREEAAREWADAARDALDPAAPKTRDLDGLRALLRSAEELRVRRSGLLAALRAAVCDAEKCAAVVRRLDLNRMRTRRPRGPDGAPARPKYRLTARELALFASEIDSLACVLPEGSAVKEALRQTDEFSRAAVAMLSREVGSLDAAGLRELREVCEAGAGLCVRLAALPAVQARLQQERWLSRARELRARPAALTPPVLARLCRDADEVPPHAAVLAERAALHKLQDEVEQWEKKAAALLVPLSDEEESDDDDDGGERDEEGDGDGEGDDLDMDGADGRYVTLEQLSALLDDADAVGAALPTRGALSAAVGLARDWLRSLEALQGRALFPHEAAATALLARARRLPLRLLEVAALRRHLRAARRWSRAAAALFLLPRAPRTALLSALRPRAPQHADRAATAADDELADHTPADIVASFKQAEATEMAYIKELRARNSRKDPRALPSPDVTFCSCRKRPAGIMTQCELCKEWYHAWCGGVGGVGGAAAGGERADDKFLCNGCVRTRRPRLERVLALLMRLQRVPLRLAAGEALQCLAERAMSWQDAARAAAAAARPEHAYSAASPAAPVLPRLEELLLLGDLLELTLDEEPPLWAAVCRARRHLGRSARVVIDVGRARRAGRAPHHAGHGKRGKPAAATNYLNRKQAGAGSSLMIRKHYAARQERRRAVGGPGSRGRRGGAGRGGGGRTARAPSSDSSSDDEDCAAAPCCRPTGRVDWVQCDGGCELWFHMLCVGLARAALGPDDDYVCRRCRR